MVRKMLFGISALLLVACGVESTTSQNTDEIINGQPSAQGAHPSTVFLYLSNAGCSGTLIAPRVVLTAEHCVSGQSSIDIFFGNNPQNVGTWRQAVSWVEHPFTDLALVTLDQPGPATPTPIYRQTPSNGQSVTIVGFGQDETGNAGIKREGTTNIAGFESDVMYVGDTGAKTCFGDSGGPTFIRSGGTTYVAAVSSFVTNGNCSTGISGNIRTDRYETWIDNYVNGVTAPTCAADGQCAAGCPAVDPDCPCADDGFCSEQCANWIDNDPDCGACAADGKCTEGCPTADPDCCDKADGQCQPGCSIAPDPDCGQIGEGCFINEDCDSNACAAVGEERLCSKSCSIDSDCPADFECRSGSACWPKGGSGCASGGSGIGFVFAIVGLVFAASVRRRMATQKL